MLLLTTGGYPVEVLGTKQGDLDISSVAALVAANFMAAMELSRLLGNASIFKSSYHEGPDYNIYSYEVNDELLLAVIFGTESRPGAVWFYTKQVASELRDYQPERSGAQSVPQEIAEALDSAIDRELDYLFEAGTAVESMGEAAEHSDLLDLEAAVAAGLIPAQLLEPDEGA